MKGKRTHLNLSESDRKLLEDTLCRAVRVSQTEVLLTQPTDPIHDALSHSQARLVALLGRVRR